MRRVQMGVAKKIKNGARKIVLDQAEEARIAAFSAFKSLGVDISKMSRPLLPGVAGDSPQRASGFEDTLVENPQVAAGTAYHGRNMMPLDIRREKLMATASMTVKATEDVSFIVGERDAYNLSVVKSFVEPSPANICPPGKLHNIGQETSQVSAGYADDILHKNVVPDQKESDTGKGNKSDYSNNKVDNQSPTNASNFPGGFDSFLDQWEAENEFFFDVHFSSHSKLSSPILFEVFGLAICWENSPVYYVNLSKDLLSSCKLSICHAVSKSAANDTTKDLNLHEILDVAKSRWNRIAKIMGQKGVKKITWNLKTQIQVFKAPSISVQRLGRLNVDHNKLNGSKLVDGSYILLLPISVHDGIDVCLMAWILWPDEESKYNPNLEKVPSF